MSAAIRDENLRVTIPIDTMYGSAFDITANMFHVLSGWIRNGYIWLLILAVPCTDDSVAADPSTHGEDRLRRRRLLLARVYRLMALCRRYGVRRLLENPRWSRFWTRRRLQQELRRSPGGRFIDYECCACGTCYRKEQRLWTDLPGFNVSLRCSCAGIHEISTG